MAHGNRSWDSLGRDIQNVVDQAVDSRDYQQLNQTVRQVVEQVIDTGGEAIQKILGSTDRQKGKQLYSPTAGRMIKAVIQYLTGIPLAMFALLGLLGGTISEESIWKYPAAVIFLMLILAAGIGLISRGAKTSKMVKRFKAYKRTLGQKTHCLVDNLAYTVGKKKGFVQKDLRQMISKGFFLEGHLDKDENTLIVSHETYHHYERCGQQYEQIKKQSEAQKTQGFRDPQVQDVLDRGNAFVTQIRKCNDAIPGEEISEKISRIELLIQRIFNRAETHPEIIADLKKLMDYYLPMTVKLLNAYADMDAQPVQGETIECSKREIEETLDTLNAAYEKLLDDLFEDTALDVSSDISVLNTLLAQEGLTEDEPLKHKEQQAP